MAESLLYIDRRSNIRPEHPRDGDVLIVARDYDIRRVWAEMIVKGKVKVICPPELRKAYLAMTNDLHRLPAPADLSDWWIEAAKLGLTDPAFGCWPWGRMERRHHLAIPVGTWLTEAIAADLVRPQTRTEVDVNGVAIQRIVQFRRAWVDWRTKLAATPDLVARLLDSNTEVDFAGEAIPEAAVSDVVIRKDL